MGRGAHTNHEPAPSPDEQPGHGNGQPRELERGSSQGKHPGTHGRRGWPPTERPQPAGAARGRRCYPRGTQPKRGTGRADRRARRPRAKSQHPGSGQHTRGGQPQRPQRGGTRHATNPPRQQTPERATQPSEQGQAGEEPTPERPSPPPPQARRGPPTQPARQAAHTLQACPRRFPSLDK